MSDLTDREHRIRQRAEKLWQEAGQPEGQDERFWHQAEAEITAEEYSQVRVPRHSRHSQE